MSVASTSPSGATFSASHLATEPARADLQAAPSGPDPERLDDRLRSRIPEVLHRGEALALAVAALVEHVAGGRLLHAHC
jgi:hypothetical protein